MAQGDDSTKSLHSICFPSGSKQLCILQSIGPVSAVTSHARTHTSIDHICIGSQTYPPFRIEPPRDRTPGRCNAGPCTLLKQMEVNDPGNGLFFLLHALGGCSDVLWMPNKIKKEVRHTFFCLSCTCRLQNAPVCLFRACM